MAVIMVTLFLFYEIFQKFSGLSDIRKDYSVNRPNGGEKEITGVLDLEEALKNLIRMLKRLIGLYKALAKLLGIPLGARELGECGNFKEKSDLDVPEEKELEKLIKEVEKLEEKIRAVSFGIAVPTTFSGTGAAIDYGFNAQDLRAIAEIIGVEAAAIFAALMVGGLFVASGVTGLLLLDPLKKKLLELKEKMAALEEIIKEKKNSQKNKYILEMIKKGEAASRAEAAVAEAGQEVVSDGGTYCLQKITADGVVRAVGK